MKKLTQFMLKHQLCFRLVKNDDGDDYHLEFYYRNEYYEIRDKQSAVSLLKYLKHEHKRGHK